MSLLNGFRWTGLGVALFGASGCSMLGGGMDGTWVFQWDRESFKEVSSYSEDGEDNATEGPSCVSSGDYPKREMNGTTYSFVEIYLTQGTGIVVSMDGQEMVGDVNGSIFEVEASFQEVVWSDEDTYDQWEWLYELDGTLADGEITGKADFKSIDATDDVECLYQSRVEYTAVKLTTESKPDRPTGTDGSGVQNPG